MKLKLTSKSFLLPLEYFFSTVLSMLSCFLSRFFEILPACKKRFQYIILDKPHRSKFSSQIAIIIIPINANFHPIEIYWHYVTNYTLLVRWKPTLGSIAYLVHHVQWAILQKCNDGSVFIRVMIFFSWWNTYLFFFASSAITDFMIFPLDRHIFPYKISTRWVDNRRVRFTLLFQTLCIRSNASM